MYRLKPGQENIQIMSGRLSGRKYEKGIIYTEIPPEEEHRFERAERPEPIKEEAIENA